MPVGARVAKLREREEELDASGDDLDWQLSELAQQQAVAHQRIQEISQKKEKALQEIEDSASALRRVTEQYENTQQRHQILSRELDQRLIELIDAEKAAAQLRERLAFQQAEIEQVRARGMTLASKDDVARTSAETQIGEAASETFLIDTNNGSNAGLSANRSGAYSKKDLPYPYSQDLSGIVTRVKGVRESTRAALVNSLKVASYLKAGANLIERNLGAPSSPASGLEGRKVYWSGLHFLSERALAREVAMLEPPFLRQKGTGPYRSTWACHDDYLNDLLAFQFHAMNYDPQYGAEMETRGDWLTTDHSVVEAIHRSAYHELQAILRMPLFRLQLIVSATADRNDGVRESIANNYAGALAPWIKVYESTLQARRLRLCNGMTMDQFANILAAITEGFAIRQLGDPTADVLGDPENNLIGIAIVGIINTYLEPVETSDDKPRG
jgi:hypothetical protein